jgi:exonuclease SbcC
MVKKLIVKNFQSHEKTLLEFVKGVNVIVGRSQSGKTALVRALQWCLFNRPSGFRFNREGCESPTTVTVEVDGKRIRHIKEKRSNIYHINKKVFSKVGRDVPDLVKQTLNVSELNVQSQLDSHFLITSSPGIVAKTINRITKFDKIDAWTKKLTRKINSLSAERDMLDGEIKDIGEEIKRFKGLAGINTKIQSLKGLDSHVTSCENEIDDLSSMVDSLEQAKQDISWAGEIEKLKAKCKGAEVLEQKIDELTEQEEALELYVHTVELLQNQKEEQASLIKEYKKALKKEKVCPTCFRPIDNHTIDQILEEL